MRRVCVCVCVQGVLSREGAHGGVMEGGRAPYLLGKVDDDEAQPVEERAVRREGDPVLLTELPAALGAARLVEAHAATDFGHERCMERIDEALVGAAGHVALVVEQREDAAALVVEQCELLRIVGERDVPTLDLLALVLLEA